MLLLMVFFVFFHLSQITYKVALLLHDNFCEHFGPRSVSNFVESDMVQNFGKVKNQLFELKKLKGTATLVITMFYMKDINKP